MIRGTEKSKRAETVEECWTLVGRQLGGIWRGRRLRYRSGEPATVTADDIWTLRREETRGDVIGFWHTHPMGGLRPSNRDIRTMRAWCDAFGKSLLCVIATPDAIAAWRFDDYQSVGARLACVERIGKTQIIGTEQHARQISSRRNLSRRGPAGAAGGTARHTLRRGSSRIKSGG